MAKFLPESLLIIYFLYQVIFEGIVNGEKGDIAIDEVTFTRNQNCSFIPDFARSTYTAGKQNISWFSWRFSILVELQFGVLVFDEEGKQEDLENKQQTQPTSGKEPESNPGHIGGRRALSPVRHPLLMLLLRTKGEFKLII